jgi:hypothetical protein
MLLIVIARGGRRSQEIDEVVGVALLSSLPTYLACRRETRAGRGNGGFEGGGERKG